MRSFAGLACGGAGSSSISFQVCLTTEWRLRVGHRSNFELAKFTAYPTARPRHNPWTKYCRWCPGAAARVIVAETTGLAGR
jgi:hypothetical protein